MGRLRVRQPRPSVATEIGASVWRRAKQHTCARKDDAERLRAQLEREGFAILLEKLTRLRWVVTASHTANPTPLYQRRMERKWIALAATVNDGRYDGWGIEWGYQDHPRLDRAPIGSALASWLLVAGLRSAVAPCESSCECCRTDLTREPWNRG